MRPCSRPSSHAHTRARHHRVASPLSHQLSHSLALASTNELTHSLARSPPIHSLTRSLSASSLTRGVRQALLGREAVLVLDLVAIGAAVLHEQLHHALVARLVPDDICD